MHSWPWPTKAQPSERGRPLHWAEKPMARRQLRVGVLLQRCRPPVKRCCRVNRSHLKVRRWDENVLKFAFSGSDCGMASVYEIS